jgi:ketosteroid isomerase-like protein
VTPGQIVRANLDAYLRQDRATCEALLSEELTFTSPQDDHISKAAFLERCFPTAERVSRQEVLHLVPLDERDVFLMYETTSRPVGPTATAR